MKIWSSIVHRILSYDATTENSSINTVLIGKKIDYITRDNMRNHLRHTVDNMSGLGFTEKDVGTHSIRSSLAMALYLKRRPVSTIMLLGRWSSDAFLLYVRRQVQEFSKGVSSEVADQDYFHHTRYTG